MSGSNVKGTAVKPSQALNLDVNQQKQFIKFFNSLSEKPSTTVRFFDRNDYYTLHGKSDAHLAAKAIFKTVSCVKIMAPGGIDELEYLCLSKGNFEILLRELLLVKNFRVEVYTNKGRSNDWILEFKGSPGNLIQFEGLLFNGIEMVDGNSTIAVNMKINGQQKRIGLASIELNERLFSVTEFDDDEFLTELEAVIVLLGPKECVIPTVDGEFSKIKTIMERNNVLITVRKRNEFSIEKSDLIQDLNKLLYFEKGQQENANALPEISKLLAMSSLGAAIKYLDLVADACNFGHYKLCMLNLDRFVYLDAAAVSALNLLPKSGTPLNSPAYRWQSVLGVLDRCRTAQGHRLMAQWVRQPLRNEAIIRDRHDIVQSFVDASSTRAELHEEYLKRVPDILMLSKKLMRKRASLKDLYRLYQVINSIPKALRLLKDIGSPTVDSVLLNPIKDSLSDLDKFTEMIEQILDVENIEKGEYLIKASFDDKLQDTRDDMDSIERKITKQLSSAASDLNVDGRIKLEYVSHIGHHFRISLKDDSVLRKNSKYRILDAVKGGVRFTTDKLSDLNEEFLRAKENYEEQQKSIVEEVIRVSLGYLPALTTLNNEIAQLDCLLSFAVAAATAPVPYVRPEMVSDGTRILELNALRHPCLELQEDVTFIANDARFEENETNMHIITGPNMGGKSTYIRSVGVAVLMAHVGAFVACSMARMSFFDSILGRIGADDNINKGLSTFMIEMIETAGIIRTATNKSLVVIDELGRGTSTYEGCGIAWSIAEHLAKETKCFTLFATHFHEITELANNLTTVKNNHMAVLADNQVFTLLYKVRAGVMDKSFGIHVAKLANFPENVVKMAQEVYDGSEDHYARMKTAEDEAAKKIFEEAAKNFGTIESDDQIRQLIDELSKNIKNTNCTYFENFVQ